MIDRSNEELGELVREWIKKYLPSIILGIVLAVGIMFLTEKNREKKRNAQHLLSQQLELLQNEIINGDLEKAKKAYAANGLDKDQSVSGDMAALLIAGVYQEQEDKTKARAAFERATNSKDNLISQTAKYQLANFFLDNQDYQAAEKYIKQLEGSVFANQIPKLKGDMAYLQAKFDEALKQYQAYQKVSPSTINELVIANLQAQINYELEKKNNPNADKGKVKFDREEVNRAEKAKLRTAEELAKEAELKAKREAEKKAKEEAAKTEQLENTEKEAVEKTDTQKAN